MPWKDAAVMWKNQNKSGKTYYSIKIGDLKFNLFENPYYEEGGTKPIASLRVEYQEEEELTEQQKEFADSVKDALKQEGKDDLGKTPF